MNSKIFIGLYINLIFFINENYGMALQRKYEQRSKRVRIVADGRQRFRREILTKYKHIFNSRRLSIIIEPEIKKKFKIVLKKKIALQRTIAFFLYNNFINVL